MQNSHIASHNLTSKENPPVQPEGFQPDEHQGDRFNDQETLKPKRSPENLFDQISHQVADINHQIPPIEQESLPRPDAPIEATHYKPKTFSSLPTPILITHIENQFYNQGSDGGAVRNATHALNQIRKKAA